MQIQKDNHGRKRNEPSAVVCQWCIFPVNSSISQSQTETHGMANTTPAVMPTAPNTPKSTKVLSLMSPKTPGSQLHTPLSPPSTPVSTTTGTTSNWQLKMQDLRE